MKVHCRWIKI